MYNHIFDLEHLAHCEIDTFPIFLFEVLKLSFFRNEDCPTFYSAGSVIFLKKLCWGSPIYMFFKCIFPAMRIHMPPFQSF